MKRFDELYESVIQEAKRETVAVVPGSFKPPTAGHWDMIQKYSKKADRVLVLISQPSAKNARQTKTGKTISAEDSRKIFKIFNKKYGLKNVSFEVSSIPSPVGAAFNYIENELQDVNVIAGASKKDGDWKRWTRLEKRMAENNPSVISKWRSCSKCNSHS
jgi:cytidyltransferase-like protein